MVYYSSQHGLVSDANLAMNASVAGVTNNQVAAQNFANLADGVTPTVLVVEGCYMIDQLRLKSNTTLQMLNSNCGFIQSSTAVKPLIMNYNPTRFNGTDTNIKIVNGILNGNGHRADGTPVKDYHSPDGIVTVLSFAGASNCSFDNVKFRNSRTFLCYIRNGSNNWYENCEFRQNNIYQVTSDVTTFLAHDGTKFGYSCHNSGVKKCTYIDIKDDWMSFCPNDGFRPDIGVNDQYAGLYAYDPYAGYGDVTGMRISDITLVNCYHGVRCLTYTHSVDDIIVERVTGDVVDFIAAIDRYDVNGVYPTNATFTANNGTITFDTFTLTVSGVVPNYPYKNCGMNIDIPIKQLNCTNWNITNTTSSRKIIRFDTGANVQSFFANNFLVQGISDPKTLIQFNGGVATGKGNLYETPTPNVFTSIAKVIIGKKKIPFTSAGLNGSNLLIIYKVGNPIKSFVPGRSINQVTDFEVDGGYYIIPKANIDLSNHVLTPAGGQ